MTKDELREVAQKLKEQWYPYHGGKCYIVSIGDKCECHLCLIDKLLALMEQYAKDRQVKVLDELKKRLKLGLKDVDPLKIKSTIDDLKAGVGK